MTIVVPAYNVERYLAECLDSLVAQSVWPDCRVIVVDDGSTDATPTIADGYAAHHPSISVLRQANAGPGAGAARNHGLDAVETEFVLFVDGDDELAPAAIEHLRAGLLAEALDLAIGATEQFPEPRRWIWSDYFVPGEARSVAIEDVPLLAHDARTCNKLYRTSWLRGLGLRFAEGIHHQDTVVNVPAMLLAERFFLVGEVVHRYRKRAEGGSVMDSHFTRLGNYWDHLQVIEELHSMRPRFSRTREPLMQAFIARSFQGFSRRAPSVVPAESLPAYFRRSAAVIRTLDPEVIEKATRGPGERAAYVTMLEDDFPSFENLTELVGRLAAHDGDLYLAVPASPPYRHLLRTGATRALATGVTSDGTGVRVQLELRIRGTERPVRTPEGISLRAFSGDQVAFNAEIVWTGSDEASSYGEAAIPWPRLEAGEYALRLHFRTSTGTAARWMRRPAMEVVGGNPVTDVIHQDRFATLTLGADSEGRAQLGMVPKFALLARRRYTRLRRRLRGQDA